MTGHSNHFICPFSIIMAFALLTEGAEGESREQFINVFGFDHYEVLPIETRYAAFKLISRKGDSDFNLANSIWARKDTPLNPYFNEIAKHKYDALLKSVDFSDPKTLNQINNWVSDKTKGMIPNLLKRLSSDQSMVIINAVYFKGRWDIEFSPRSTRKGTFTTSRNEQKKIDFMHKTSSILYHEDSKFKYGGFKYIDSTVIMVTALPKAGVDPLNGLDLKVVASLGKKGRNWKFKIKMPKFKMDKKIEMKPVLESLGLTAPFKNFKDFSWMVKGGAVVSEVIHQAKIEVDEKGTRAAAATAIKMMRRSSRPRYRSYYLNKPFSFFLVDTASDMILFSGVFRTPPN